MDERKLEDALDVACPKARELAQQIYDNPELSNQEHRAAGWTRELLDAASFDIDDVPGLPTALIATKRGRVPGPVVGLLAEYDALPEIGHACGHHLIAGSAVGAGLALAHVMGDLPGQVKVFGCPAEETGEGKIAMLKAGAFEGVDFALTFHAYARSSVMTSSNGIQQLEFTFAGVASHAATDPWAGASALDGVLLTFQNVNALRQFTRDGTRIHGIITDGGQAHNVIPERARCLMSVRATDPTELQRVVDRTVECAEAAAMSSGTTLSVRHAAKLDPVQADRVVSTVVRRHLERLGEESGNWEALASTDFGNVSAAIPSVLFSVATWPEEVAFHTREAAALSGRPEAFRAMETGVRVMAAAAADLLLDRH